MPAGAVLALLAGLAGCADEQESRALWELERLAFVPDARSVIEGYRFDCSLEEPLLVDLFEVRRADWLHYFPDPGEGETPPFGEWMAGATDETLDWPAALSCEEAEELARRRGMRLLRAREWIHVAVGRRFHPYPWGRRFQKGWANTRELGLVRPAPVGTFESGRSQPFGCYDLLGNVWEWVLDPVDGYGTPAAATSYLLETDPLSQIPGAGRALDGPAPRLEGDGLSAVMGGSFRSRQRETFGPHGTYRRPVVFHSRTLDRRHRADDIGVRHCAEARTYLWEQAASWGEDEDARRRLVAVGRRWSAESGRFGVLPLLEELADRPGAPPGLRWIADGAGGPP